MVKQLTSLLFLVAAMTTGLWAAQGVPAPIAVSPTYLIGPSDVLAIKVFDEPALSGTFSVDSDGTITFPYLQRIAVRGKTLSEVETMIATGLRDGYVLRAQVSVEISQYRSRSIYVMGEVKAPGKYTIEGQVTLLEVIAKAGSFTPSAGTTIIVQRYKDGMAAAVAAAPASPDSTETAELLRVSIEDLKAGRFTANVLLQDSDTIIVQAAERYYVTGFVRTPGAFVLRPGMTVQQAIAEAGGLTERGSSRGIKITRKVNGKDIEVDAEMSDLVRPNDTIKVRQRLI
ncbi:MAG: polysaccharide biosynthesis/export family protein [Vicinamibacterales bacterium]|jgi:polysaccharide export outer membrane protein